MPSVDHPAWPARSGRATNDDSTCIFCRIVAGTAPAQIVYRDDDVVVFVDIHPAAPTHLLVVPRRHIPSLAAVEAADIPLLGKLLFVAASVAREQGLAERGYRLVVNTGRWGGQTIDHLHVHLLGGKPMKPTLA
jgi:histidine triad (HIT) family protein